MKYKLTNKQLFNSFKSIMREYSELQEAERSYDFYNYEEGRYVDLDVYNYYKDVDEDWEYDNWILQVQYMKGDAGKGMELPILRYSDWRFMTLKSLFGDLFEPLLKEWFNNTYPVKTPIKTVTKEND
jgi:hypothetical protein